MARTSTSTDRSGKRTRNGFSNGSLKKTGSKTSKTTHKTLDDLFEEGLKDIYNAEKQLLEVLPKMAKAAYSEDLQDAFNKHVEQTRRQSERLEKIFERLDIDKNEEEFCEAMQGLIKEAEQIMNEFDRSPVRDSALIIGSQKVEHYEIASYGSLCELADVLGYTKISDILGRSLQEEEDTDRHLTSIAQDVNDEACEMSYEMEEEEEMA